jgi:hypothetical protein
MHMSNGLVECKLLYKILTDHWHEQMSEAVAE